jgi:hypothetical protein
LLGKEFPWRKPGLCPHCHSSLWWHGFVIAYFSCCPEAVYVRRLRCPCCGAVHRLKPSGYFRRFRSSIQEIKESIDQRSNKNRWRPDLPRARQRRWWRRLVRMISTVLGVSYSGSPLQAFKVFMKHNIIPVSSAKKKENRTVF